MNKIYFDLDCCIFCGENFSGTLRKTKHHIIPKRFEPKVEALIPLCQDCHNKLNENDLELFAPTKDKDFNLFKQTYLSLKGQFKAKVIDRGKFGEGLWNNLMDYLETEAKK